MNYYDDMLEACIKNDLEKVKECITQGIDPREDDDAFLYTAIHNLSVDVVKYLYLTCGCRRDILRAIDDDDYYDDGIHGLIDFIVEEKIWNSLYSKTYELSKKYYKLQIFIWAMRMKRFDIMKTLVEDQLTIFVEFNYTDIHNLTYEMLQFIFDNGGVLSTAIVYYGKGIYHHWNMYCIIENDKDDLFRCLMDNKKYTLQSLKQHKLLEYIVKGSNIENSYNTLKGYQEMYDNVMNELLFLPGFGQSFKDAESHYCDQLEQLKHGSGSSVKVSALTEGLLRM